MLFTRVYMPRQEFAVTNDTYLPQPVALAAVIFIAIFIIYDLYLYFKYLIDSLNTDILKALFLIQRFWNNKSI